MAASWSYPKSFINGEVLTHTDLNAQFQTIPNNCGVASGIATLNSSTLAVEYPANAQATKSAGKICKWGTSEAFQCSALTATAIAGTTGAFSGQITSTVTTDTAPLVIASTTEVANLKAATATTATTATNLSMNGEASNSTSNLSATFTVTIASPAVFTSAGHGLDNDDAVHFTTTGALPTGLLPNYIYWVVNKSTNTFEVSLTPGGASVNTSGSQSGTHTWTEDTALYFSNVTSGDRIFVTANLSHTTAAAGYKYLQIEQYQGTATILFNKTLSTLRQTCLADSYPIAIRINITGICRIVGTGTLVLRSIGPAGTSITNELYAVFLKKQ